MSKHLTRELVAEQAIIVAAPKPLHEVDRTFQLPKGLYAATVGLYLGFLVVMAVGFSTPGLIIPMAIFTIIIVAGFGVPAVWTRLSPITDSKQITFSKLQREGISTLTGRLSAKDASVQMLVLPINVFCWGVATVSIATLVR